MGFAGNLQTLALPEVLQTLHRIQATGVLRLTAREGGRDLIFDRGELIGVAFRRGEEKQAVLRRLILDGKLDAAAAAQISQAGRESQVLARLIDSGALEQRTVDEAVQRQAEDELQSLFTWDYADFVFEDAGGDDPEVDALVAKARAEGRVFSIPALLMESARRQDEWERVRAAAPEGGAVLGAAAGREAELAAEAAQYPGSAVIPLIDAVRSVDDIVRDSVASRLDTLSCLARLAARGLVVPLSRDDILYHADYLASQGDHRRASLLYRRALAARPQDHETARKLAETLARLGDAPEAAASYAQLALGALDRGEREAAIAHARRAAQLAPKDAQAHRALARCLLAGAPADAERHEALTELLVAAQLCQEQGRLEEARRACLEVLDLDLANEPARRQLARLFIATATDEIPTEAVACVRCGHRNPRDSAHCSQCRAPLALPCLACGRQIGVSDRVCIYCGADPHRGGAGTRRPGGPPTNRLVNPEKVRPGAIPGGAQAIRDQLAGMVASARAKEAAEDWEGALAAWRAVAKVLTDSAELQAHLRRLEHLAHDAFVERTIEEGHQLRRARRYWAAIRRYRAALRTMASDDPRVGRLNEILASTARVAQRSALLYAAAALVILAGAALAVRPWLVERRLGGELEQLAARLAEAQDGPALAVLKPELDAASARVEALGERPRWQALRIRAQELAGAWAVAWQRAAARSLAQAETAIEQGDLKRARELLAAHQAQFHDRSPRAEQAAARLEAAQRRRDELNARIQDAPRLWAAAEAEERAGRLGAALAAYRALVESPNAEVARQATEAVARLAPRADAAAKRVEEALVQAEALLADDLPRAEALLAAVADEAAVWGLAERVRAARAGIAAALAQARAEALRLGPDAGIEQLEAFLVRFPGAPEAAMVRQRRDALVRAREARQQALARYRELMEREQWEQAWRAGRDLVAGYGAEAGEVLLPLVIASEPPAAVALDGRPLGATPLVLRYRPGQRGELLLSAPGFEPQRRRLERAAEDWRLQVALAREARWRHAAGRPLLEVAATPDGGWAALAADAVLRLDAEGRLRWQAALAGDELGGRARSDALVPLPEGELAVADPGGGLLVLTAQGAVRQRLPAQAPVRGRPASYVNEVLGALPRLAYAAEAVYSGVPGAEFRAIPLPAAAISGPLPWPQGLDRWLIVADARGRLVAVEESTRRPAWELDLQAVDVGRLMAVPGGLVAVQDGNRLVMVGIAASGPLLRWSQLLPGPALGSPALLGDAVLVACGERVVRIGIDGVPRPPWALPAPAATPVAADGRIAAVGLADGRLAVLYEDGRGWTGALPAPPVAVAVGGLVVAADAAGTLHAFAP